MSDPEKRLDDDRALRNSARGLFDGRLQQVKEDLAARGIGGRIADKVSGEVKAAADEAKAIAAESKGIIAATVAALGLWFFRKPLLAAGRKLIGRDQAAVKPGALDSRETTTEDDE